MSATVTPRSNAAILIRARKSGVTSMVSRAVKELCLLRAPIRFPCGLPQRAALPRFDMNVVSRDRRIRALLRRGVWTR